ncbi:MAG: hypothetical protein JWN73_2039 [Betaproteobacteria bacterium]|nr:hypothetical protein [Betaproteobacteria bacterium]
MQLIALRFSPRFAALKWAAAGLTSGVAIWLALACVWAISLPLLLGVALLVALVLRAQTPQGSLRLRREGFCEWITMPGAHPAEMTVAGLFGAAGWLVLRLRPRNAAGRDLILVLAPDAAAPDEMRQLRVWLKLAAPRADLNSGGVQWS